MGVHYCDLPYADWDYTVGSMVLIPLRTFFLTERTTLNGKFWRCDCGLAWKVPRQHTADGVWWHRTPEHDTERFDHDTIRKPRKKTGDYFTVSSFQGENT